jgi:hypothetical protein
VLAPFDFALEGVYEGLLPLAWAAFFFFLEPLGNGLRLEAPRRSLARLSGFSV